MGWRKDGAEPGTHIKEVGGMDTRQVWPPAEGKAPEVSGVPKEGGRDHLGHVGERGNLVSSFANKTHTQTDMIRE